MRPVNLIPPEQRRGERGQTRTGPLPYVVLGGLAAAVLAVTAVVYTGKQISDREGSLAELETREQAAQARAAALEPYAEFASLAEARQATVTSLAQSRFDWERPLRELSLLMPDDVWLTGLTATVTPDVSLEDGPTVSLREEVPGPALSIVGCGASHEAVARFLETLKDIDGVTRVGIATDERSTDASSAQSSAAGGGGAESDCRTRDFISKFEIVAAFDAVPTPEAATVAPPATPAVPADDGGVGEAQATEQQGTNSVATQTTRAHDAASGVVAGVAR